MKHRPGSFTVSRFFLMALVIIVMTGAAVAQTTTATIRGRVLGESGEGVAAADVVATNVASGFTSLAVSQEDGSFVLAGLTPGTYTILVASAAYRQTTEERTVLVGQTIDLVFRLTPSSVLSEEITVLGDTFVETKTSEIATNVTRRQIESLPQNDRNFLNFAALAPGVVLGNDEVKKQVKAGAQSSAATNVFIDGVSFKNDVIEGGVVGQDSSRGNPFPQNAVQEFRVITQNYSAEYQKASSAIITAITKSGSNTLTGDAFIYYQDKELVEENPLTGANPEYERMQYGLSLGGPIVHDKMHFFLSYEANNQDREETVVLGSRFANDTALRQQLQQYVGTFVSPFRSDLFFAKVSLQPMQSQLVDLSFHFRDETDIRSFGGGISREAAENVKNSVWGTTLRHQFTQNTWLNEFSLSYQDYSWNPQPLNPDKVGLVYEGLLDIGGRPTEQDIGQTRLSFRDDITFTDIKALGAHTMKFGAIIETLDYTVTKFEVENPQYYFCSEPDRPFCSSTMPYKARYGLGDPDLSASNTEFGVYVQDDWTISPKLLVNLGLRWDYETDMMNPDYETPLEVRERLSDQLPARYFTDGNDRDPATDLFQPRLGLSYDVFASGRTVAFAGAGRYYDRVLFNSTFDERFKLQHQVGEFFFSEDGSPVFGQPAAVWDPRYLTEEGLQELRAQGITGKPEVYLIENDTQVPYSDQWNIGVRQSLGSMVASASYANIRSYHGFSFLWGAGRCCPQFDPAYGNVIVSSDDIRTWYDAVYLTLDRPFTNRWGFNVAYTWSDAEQIGNVNDPFSFDLPTIADWPRYGTPGTQDHRIVANGILGLPWDTRVSSILQYSSGDKFKIHSFPNGFCGDNTCYVPVTGESPSWLTIDLRAEKDFRVGPARMGIILEGFNLTNEERYSGFVDFNPPEGNPDIGKPTTLVGGSQRRYQVGLRVGF